jgi:hypothetical protein
MTQSRLAVARRYRCSGGSSFANRIGTEAVQSVEPSTTSLHFFLRNHSHSTTHEFRQEALFFPLGFPVRILSNSHDILKAAEQSWNCFESLFGGPPLEVRIGVKAHGAGNGRLPPAPIHSFRGNLLLLAADEDNFTVADLKNGRSVSWVTEITAASTMYLRYHFLEAAALAMVSSLRAVPIHAACVQHENSGILLCGDSGASKSSLSYGCARAGWTFVCDDASYIPIDRTDRLVVGNCHQVRFRPSASEIFPEIEGRAITPRAAGKPSIEIRTSEWTHLSTNNSASIEHIVFLDRRKGDLRQELIPLQSATVCPWFMRTLFPTVGSHTEQEASIRRLLTAPVYELRYQELAWAIDRLHQLAATGK